MTPEGPRLQRMVQVLKLTSLEHIHEIRVPKFGVQFVLPDETTSTVYLMARSHEGGRIGRGYGVFH